MASGLGGSVRFTGITLGIAGLGVVLYSRVAAIVAQALPGADRAAKNDLIQAITGGHLQAAALQSADPVAFRSLAVSILANGYQSLLVADAIFMALCTFLTWRLVRADQTQPVARPVAANGRVAVA
jgi:hypothetical protein